MSKVSIDQLSAAITEAVRDYTEDVAAGIDREVETTADAVLKEVKQLAPKRYGYYVKGFIKADKSLPGNRRYIIWNKEYYRLVHLLEFGHAKVNGGRVEGKAHIGPVHDKYVKQLPENIKKIIRNGG